MYNFTRYEIYENIFPLLIKIFIFVHFPKILCVLIILKYVCIPHIWAVGKKNAIGDLGLTLNMPNLGLQVGCMLKHGEFHVRAYV